MKTPSSNNLDSNHVPAKRSEEQNAPSSKNLSSNHNPVFLSEAKDTSASNNLISNMTPAILSEAKGIGSEEHSLTNHSLASATTDLKTQHLQINDLFWTVQGEGRWTGRRALFVRLPFCNYDCPWCDTEYNSFKKIAVEDFVNFIKQEPSRFAVITGGEPMAHKDLARIIMLLKKEGFYIACETNGSLPIPSEIDFPTVSPKRYTQKKYPEYFIHEDAMEKAKEFKYVVDDDFDFQILERHNREVDMNENSSDPLTTPSHEPQKDLNPSSNEQIKNEVRLSLTPEYSKMQKQLPRILKYIQENPKWQLNLQTHKWINIP